MRAWDETRAHDQGILPAVALSNDELQNTRRKQPGTSSYRGPLNTVETCLHLSRPPARLAGDRKYDYAQGSLGIIFIRISK